MRGLALGRRRVNKFLMVAGRAIAALFVQADDGHVVRLMAAPQHALVSLKHSLLRRLLGVQPLLLDS